MAAMTNDAKNPLVAQQGLGSERRAFPRYTFIATADMIEPSTQTRLSGRVSEISRRGCFIDVLNTLPKGTAIHVRITTDTASFTCSGHIMYEQERMGIGVAFDPPSPDQQLILEGWLAELGR